jgi:Raf kinase inhibitor-like YbhB/YbcL family protein
MKIESAAFAPEAMIPSRHTCDGEDLSPPLTWADPPEGTKSFALISDDPDAPGGTWVHWVVWNIPASSRGLAQGMPKSAQWTDGTRQGITDFRRVGYGGPCPPSGTHRYFFRLYALDAMLDLAPGARRIDLEGSMRGHVLAQAELMGKYQRS